jgi:hypothetical protein
MGGLSSCLDGYTFTAQIRQAFGKVVIVVFGINRAADRFFRQIGIGRAGVAAMVFIAPRGIWPVAALLHFVHDEDVVGIEQIGAVGEDVVYGSVRPAPAVAAQGGAFAVLTEQLGAGELGDKDLVPQAHGDSLNKGYLKKGERISGSLQWFS